MLELTDYFSGGYFLIKADKPDWPGMSNDLLPEKLISLSTCICPRLAVHWGWIPGDKNAAMSFGIPEIQFAEFAQWCSDAFGTENDIFSMFYTLGYARRFIERFLPDSSDLFLIGAGLHRDRAHFWREDPEPALQGIPEHVAKQLPIEYGGSVLGYDVVSFSYHDFGHSWLCSGLLEEMRHHFEIRPNHCGLIDTIEEAKRIVDWINKEPDTRAEPEPYDYWLMTSYPLRAGP